MPGYTVGIGPQKIAGNDTFTRAGYDKNPFYFWWKYKEDKYISAGFVSSSDYFVTEAQWWTLTSTKNGNGFDIGGSYTGKPHLIYSFLDCDYTIAMKSHLNSPL
jgi:hypothetical protein